jgi:hypothetical protein
VDDHIAARNLLPVDNVEAIDEKLIDERLTELDHASRQVRQQIGIVSFRHSPAGDRRVFNRDRRSGAERRIEEAVARATGTSAPRTGPPRRKPVPPANPLTPRKGAERRAVTERRLPHDERARELETTLRQLTHQNQQLYRLRESIGLCRPGEGRRA